MKLTSNVKKGIIVGSAVMVLTGGITALIKYNRKKAKESVIEEVVNSNEDDDLEVTDIDEDVVITDAETGEVIAEIKVEVKEDDNADKQDDDKKKKDK